MVKIRGGLVLEIQVDQPSLRMTRAFMFRYCFNSLILSKVKYKTDIIQIKFTHNTFSIYFRSVSCPLVGVFVKKDILVDKF